jgi:hypothetical protein
MNTTTPNQDIQGAVRIGSGAKLHRARKDSVYGLVILCGCPGTQSGNAYHRARFFAGMESNCKN